MYNVRRIFSFSHLLIYLIAQYWSIVCLTPFGDDVIHDREDLGEGFGTEEGDAGLLEVIKTFEDRRGSKMTTRMNDAFAFVVATPDDGGKDVFFQDRDLFLHRPRRSR